MANKPLKDRLEENESVFRQHNERVQRSIDDLKQMAKEDGMDGVVDYEVDELYFYCECSDEDCKDRIRLDPAKYDEIHCDRRQFVMVPGHEIPAIEQLVAKGDGYFIVKKKDDTPEDPGRLNNTPLNNK